MTCKAWQSRGNRNPFHRNQIALHTVAFLQIDGVELKDPLTNRFHSEDFVLEVATPSLLGTDAGNTTAVGDGYYAIFETLSPDTHEILIKAGMSDLTLI